jgi:hypothetical protein
MFYEEKGPKDLMILISGRSHPMPSQVLQYLVDLLSMHGKSRESIEVMLKEKKRKKELVFETWGV